MTIDLIAVRLEEALFKQRNYRRRSGLRTTRLVLFRHHRYYLLLVDRHDADHWSAFFDSIATNIFNPCHDPNCCRRSSPELVPSCHAAMERLYVRVLYALRDNTESDGSVLLVWDKLAGALGIMNK